MDINARKSELQNELDKLNKIDSVIDGMIKTASEGGFTHVTREQLVGLLLGERPTQGKRVSVKEVHRYMDDKGNLYKRPPRKKPWTNAQKNKYRQAYKDKWGE